MTSNTLLSKIKTKLILALIIVGLLSASLLFLSACNNEDNSSSLPSYSYKETDDGLISNPNFNYNTSSIKLENFPQTSPTGWSRSKDTDGNSSSAKSGVIDLSADGWTAYLNSIYSDSNYLGYLEGKLGFSKSDIESAAKDENSEITSSELKAKVVEKYKDVLTAPVLKAEATDNKVYILNNYTSNKYGIGASQKVTSNKSITIEKGGYVKITVDVLTQSIKNAENTEILGMTGANNDFGASIRLVNTFNSATQSDFVIANINTNGAWQTYTLYAKGDAEFDCAVTLALGLGYSDLYPTEGTVYFDNITVEEIDSVNEADLFKKSLNYNKNENKDTIINLNSSDATGKTSFLYDMSLSIEDANYYQAITPTTSGELTKANNEATSVDKVSNSSASFENGIVTLSNSSYTVKVEDSSFTVAPEKYAYVSFKVKNNLNKLANTTITVDVYEKYDSNIADGNLDATYKTDKKVAVATVTETGESTVSLMVKNNFDKTDYANQNRFFYLSIVIGPTNISSSAKLSDFASGTVEISDFKIATGETYQYDSNNNETENYKYYQLFTNVSDGSTSLFAGFSSDYTANTDDSTTSTGFAIAATYEEYLNKKPVAPAEYDGIGYDHIYLNKDSTISNVNDRTNGNTDGSFAGVIDTKYAYDASYVKPSTLPTLEEDIRPLMIYNATADSYGYVSNKGAQVVAANSFAKVSAKVRVDGDAKAYIYLVDTATKEVMKFEDFTPNSDGISSISNAQPKTAEEFKFVVGNTNGEWVDVVFYIATGKTEKSFRVELWNGGRDGADTSKSQGYVFFNSVNVTLSGAFTEPTSFKDSFTSSTSPLNAQKGAFSGDNGEYLCYSRPLTETEKKFNEEYSDKAISYSPKIIWAKNDTTIYAIFNTLDVTVTDPYDTIDEEAETESSGCAAETDPATFWLSFSSILLAVVLILALVALFVKKFRRKRKSSDAKSHYTVKSRVRSVPKATKTAESKETATEQATEEVVEESEEKQVEESAEGIEATEEPNEAQEENAQEPTLDDYVYGDVQDFGEDTKSDDKE